MFHRPAHRFKALLSLVDDVLGDPEPEYEPEVAPPHPHDRTVNLRITRRAGSVPARPAHCLSPVTRAPGPRPGRDRIEN